jgi:hypothetical protein
VAPPGWYPDPWRLAPQRWWDGIGWWATPADAAYGTFGPGSAAAVGASFEVEEKWWRRARVAVCLWAIGLTAEEIAEAFLFRGFLRNFRNFAQQAQNAGNSSTPPKIVLPDVTGFAAVDLLGLLALAPAIVFFIWQHDTAKVARGLGYPARISPTWGVVGWFVPIVSFWFPYQALVDCLPPHHRSRRLGLIAWLAYLGTSLFFAIAILCSIFSAFVAIPFGVVAIGCATTAVLLGQRLITDIHDAHAKDLGANLVP